MFTQNKNLKKIETPVFGETLSMLLLVVMPRHWLPDVVFSTPVLLMRHYATPLVTR